VNARRYPITEGCRCQHLDGRLGRVIELCAVDGLPGALVDLEPKDRRQPHTRERLALGFICWVGHGVET
jgi:hypothetical protein